MDVHQYVKVAYVRVTPVKICTQGENVNRRLTTDWIWNFFGISSDECVMPGFIFYFI